MLGKAKRADSRETRDVADEAERAKATADPDHAAPFLPTEGREPELGDAITFEQIRERAYDLWERNHRPEGLEMQFWLVAERELRAERERRLANRSAAPGE